MFITGLTLNCTKNKDDLNVVPKLVLLLDMRKCWKTENGVCRWRVCQGPICPEVEGVSGSNMSRGGGCQGPICPEVEGVSGSNMSRGGGCVRVQYVQRGTLYIWLKIHNSHYFNNVILWGLGGGGDIKYIGNLLTMWTRYTSRGLSLNILYIFHIYSEISKY